MPDSRTFGKSAVDRLRADWLKIEPVATWIIYIEWALWIGLIVIGSITAIKADSTADWLVANAVHEGISPYTDLRYLADQEGISFLTPAWSELDGGVPWIHPRTPAALLLLQPLTLLDPKPLHTLVVVVSLALLAFIGSRHLGRFAETRWPLGLLLASLLLLSGPLLRSLQFGAWSVLMAAVVGSIWLALRRDADVVGGALLGLLAGIRLFPALLILPVIAFKKRSVAWIAVTAATLLNLVGVVVFSLDPLEIVEGITTAGDTWIELRGNASIIAPLHDVTGLPSLVLVAVLGLVLAGYVWRLKSHGANMDLVLAVTIVAMLLLSPLSWEHYDVILFPVVAWLLGSAMPRALRWGAGVWIVLMTAGFVVRQPWEQAEVLGAGLPSLIGRIILLVVMVTVAERTTRQPSRPMSASLLARQPGR